MHAAAASDPYLVLGVPRTATAAEIRAAYLALGARYHPDLHQGNSLRELATAKMAEINGAYEVLSDPAQRAALDATRRDDFSTAGRNASNHTTAAGGRGVPTRAPLAVFFVLVLIPLALRFGGLVLRGLVALIKALMEGLTLMRGTPFGLVVALLAASLLLFALWRHHRRRQ